MRLSKYSALILLTLALSACGGGGGGGGTVASNTGTSSGTGGGTGTGGGGTGTGGGGTTTPGPDPVNGVDPSTYGLTDAAQAKDDAGTTEGMVNDKVGDSSKGASIGEFITASPTTIISSAMGVSGGIAKNALDNLEGIKEDIDEIEGYLQVAQYAYENLEKEVDRLGGKDGEVEKLKGQVSEAEQEAIEIEGKIEDLELEVIDIEDVIVVWENEERTGTRTYMGRDYTYAEMKALVESKRMEATEKDKELSVKREEVIDLQNQAFEAESELVTKRNEADEAEGYRDDIDEIWTLLKDSLDDWQTAVDEDTESEKAKQVFALLASVPLYLHSAKPPVREKWAVTDALTDLDTMDYVFARAPRPAETMTFEDIANGNDAWNLQRRSLFKADGSTPIHLPADHPAIVLTGLKTSDFVPADGSQLGSLSVRDTVNGQLNGIEGTLYCDTPGFCGLTGDDLFDVGWYFTPAVKSSRQASIGYDSTEARYEDSDGDGTYEVASYVDYGMWLTGVDDDLTLQRRVGVVGPPQVPVNSLGFYFPAPTNATYTGKARGLSARNTGTGDDPVYASGHFEADVKLVATFGWFNPQDFSDFVLPGLEGKIDNFRAVAGQGSGHVDAGWSLRLLEARINQGVVSPGVIYVGSQPAGSWDATAYGDTSGEAPDGFYGSFSVSFGVRFDDPDDTHGAAVGLYYAD